VTKPKQIRLVFAHREAFWIGKKFNQIGISRENDFVSTRCFM